MSGSQKNEWNSYLNGGTPQYNFSYKDKSLNTSLEPVTEQNPQIVEPQSKTKASPFNSNPYIKNKKQTAGKRTSRHSHRRSHKKYRQSRRK